MSKEQASSKPQPHGVLVERIVVAKLTDDGKGRLLAGTVIGSETADEAFVRFSDYSGEITMLIRDKYGNRVQLTRHNGFVYIDIS